MNVRPIILFLTLILSGVAAGTPAPVVKTRTLASDPRVPAANLEELFGVDQWKTVSAMPYRAIVIFDTLVNENGSMTSGTVRASEPDATWIEPARKLAKTVKVKGGSVGTHILPAGEVFVIFYGQGEGRRAILYARQHDALAGGAYNKNQYLGIEKF